MTSLRKIITAPLLAWYRWRHSHALHKYYMAQGRLFYLKHKIEKLS